MSRVNGRRYCLPVEGFTEGVAMGQSVFLNSDLKGASLEAWLLHAGGLFLFVMRENACPGAAYLQF
jgi:hypothetical protein